MMMAVAGGLSSILTVLSSMVSLLLNFFVFILPSNYLKYASYILTFFPFPLIMQVWDDCEGKKIILSEVSHSFITSSAKQMKFLL